MSVSRTNWLPSAPDTASNPRAETPLFPHIARLIRREDLTLNEAAELMRALTAGGAGSNQIASVLTALTIKGETSDELAGMATALRSIALPVDLGRRTALDITGTGSSTAKAFNVSTAAALVAAGAGLTIAKQSNRGVTTRVGSADVLGDLGIKVSGEADVAELSLAAAGVAFLFAPKFHPALRRVAEVRRSLGIRTCLNLLGILSNPAGVRRQLLGVWHRSMVEPAARALVRLGSERAWVVHGSDGMDEISLAGPTLVAEVNGQSVKGFKIAPKDFGLRAAPTAHLRAATPRESGNIIREVLGSKRRDEARALVVINAAAAIYIGGIAKDPIHAARLAEQSIDSGQAQNKLDRLIQVTSKK